MAYCSAGEETFTIRAPGPLAAIRSSRLGTGAGEREGWCGVLVDGPSPPAAGLPVLARWAAKTPCQSVKLRSAVLKVKDGLHPQEREQRVAKVVGGQGLLKAVLRDRKRRVQEAPCAAAVTPAAGEGTARARGWRGVVYADG